LAPVFGMDIEKYRATPTPFGTVAPDHPTPNVVTIPTGLSQDQIVGTANGN